ncbi:MAG: hypothetical protein N4A62_19630 [Marinisporobacter sp.]|nr:hypothetical protein [Marinisporobacter sp.]
MNSIFYLTMALILIIFSLVLLRKKKVMISRIFEQSFLMIFMWGNFLIVRTGIELKDMCLITVTHLVVAIMLSMVSRRKYSIYNINKEEATVLIKTILEEKEIQRNINLEKINCEEKLVCVNWDFFNVVEIYFDEVIDIQLRWHIIREIRERLNSINRKYFSYAGIGYLFFGLVLLELAIQWYKL